MIEREMQELLWLYPERFLNEPLKQVAWEPPSAVGRADLVFEDRHGRLLVIEVKHGKLPRGAIDQLLDYFGMMKQRFPDKPVELMVVASVIPAERRLTCESRDIECREISERMSRDVAPESSVRAFASEVNGTQAATETATSTPRTPDTGGQKGRCAHLQLVIQQDRADVRRCTRLLIALRRKGEDILRGTARRSESRLQPNQNHLEA